MALVKARQTVVLEGYTYKPVFTQTNLVRKLIKVFTAVECICDETEVEARIEEKIKEKMQQVEGWGENFEGWSSYRKYLKPGESPSWPKGKKTTLDIEYIRNWKMEKIIKELDANQFAILCKELGMNITEKIKNE